MDTGRNFQLMRVFRHSLEVERYKKVIKISSLFPKLNKILRNIIVITGTNAICYKQYKNTCCGIIRIHGAQFLWISWVFLQQFMK